MVKTSTVQKWNIPELGVEENDREEVTYTFCKFCREFYANNNADLNKLNGTVKQVVLNLFGYVDFIITNTCSFDKQMTFILFLNSSFHLIFFKSRTRRYRVSNLCSNVLISMTFFEKKEHAKVLTYALDIIRIIFVIS